MIWGDKKVKKSESPGYYNSNETYHLYGRCTVDKVEYVSIKNDNLNHAVTDTAWWTTYESFSNFLLSINQITKDDNGNINFASSDGTITISPNSGLNEIDIIVTPKGTAKWDRFWWGDGSKWGGPPELDWKSMMGDIQPQEFKEALLNTIDRVVEDKLRKNKGV